MLAHQTIQKIDRLLQKDSDDIVEYLLSSTSTEKVEIFDMLRMCLTDLKSTSHIVISLKNLLKANSSISVSLLLSDALDGIVHETCKMLDCDRVI